MNDRNYELCQEYPFLIPKDPFSGEMIKNYDYSFTYLDECPEGWRELFFNMCTLIKPILIKYEKLNDFRLLQVKEKYGRLAIYHAGAPESVNDIISYYEHLSCKVCVGCGKPATKITPGWISPWCDECASEHGQYCIDIDEWFKEIKE